MKKIGFICTGNTCRSPMAGCYFKSIVNNQDVEVFTAGLSAGFGWKASMESMRIMGMYQLDLSNHVSQPLTENLIMDADMLVCMTDHHKQAILSKWPESQNKVFLLREFEENPDYNDINVFDPVGCPIVVYEKCFLLMKKPLERLGEMVCKKSS